MSSDLQQLTQQELLSLALDALKREDAGRALAYLKEAAARDDASAQVLFMLGSEYAQIGMIPEAKAALDKSLHAVPELPIARFQLGLLQLTTGDVTAARSVWMPLLDLPASSPLAYLRCFAQGLLDVSVEAWDSARSALLEGLALNLDNAALNKDMQGVLERMEAARAGQGIPAAAPSAAPSAAAPATTAPAPEAATTASASPADVDASHLFISAYKHRGKPH